MATKLFSGQVIFMIWLLMASHEKSYVTPLILLPIIVHTLSKLYILTSVRRHSVRRVKNTAWALWLFVLHTQWIHLWSTTVQKHEQWNRFIGNKLRRKPRKDFAAIYHAIRWHDLCVCTITHSSRPIKCRMNFYII